MSPGPVTGFALPLDGIHEFADSKTYVPDPPAGNMLGPIDQLTLQARDRTRPYIRLVPDAAASEITFAGPVPAAPPRTLTIDGLVDRHRAWDWPSRTSRLKPTNARRSRRASSSTASSTASRSGAATLDPGGERARIDPLVGVPIPYVALEVRGQVEELIIDRAIVGPVREASAAGDPCSIGRLTIRDSIVQSLTYDPPRNPKQSQRSRRASPP